MVEEVVRQVIADVTKDTATENSSGYAPVPVEDGMCKFPEGRCQCEEKSRWHYKSEFVHGKVVMNAME